MGNDHPRLLLAAPASGGGKTTLTLALLGAFLARGLKPAAFKCGPDYIDPMFHREVLGVPGRNLDLFFAAPDIVRGLFRRGASGADLSVIEGVMGYYDGIGASDAASTWRVALETGTPAVLALTPGSSSLSLAALVKGFLEFRKHSGLGGLVLNRCGDGMFKKLAPALEKETGLKVYGYLPDVPEAALKSRHLGLVTPDSVEALREKIAALAVRAKQTLDVSGLLSLAISAPPLCGELPGLPPPVQRRPRIAVARDAAFCFYYQENLEMLEALGADLVYFSPLADSALPGDIGGLYLGGGYPELHAEALSANAPMRAAIRGAVASGLPALAECGGFLYLQAELQNADGVRRPMVGALPGTGFAAGRSVRFGYATLVANRDSLLARRGETIRAHEFHHWDCASPGDGFTAQKAGDGREWPCIAVSPTLHAGFPHLYFWSHPDFAKRFVEAAGEFRGS